MVQSRAVQISRQKDKGDSSFSSFVALSSKFPTIIMAAHLADAMWRPDADMEGFSLRGDEWFVARLLHAMRSDDGRSAGTPLPLRTAARGIALSEPLQSSSRLPQSDFLSMMALDNAKGVPIDHGSPRAVT